MVGRRSKRACPTRQVIFNGLLKHAGHAAAKRSTPDRPKSLFSLRAPTELGRA